MDAQQKNLFVQGCFKSMKRRMREMRQRRRYDYIILFICCVMTFTGGVFMKGCKRKQHQVTVPVNNFEIKEQR